MSGEPQPPRTPSSAGFNSAFVAFARALVRLIVVLLMGGLLGMAVFIGLPYLNQQIVVPIQQNQAAIAELRASQRGLESETDGWLETLQARLLALEIAQDTLKQQADSLASQSTALQAANDNLAATVTARGEQLSALATQAAAPDPQATRIARSLTRQSEQINELQENLADLETLLQDQDNTEIAALNRELQILKAGQLLTRARLALARSDIAAARSEANNARDVVMALLDAEAEAEENSALPAIIQRLELAVRNLDEAPLLAVEDIEIAYQLLLGLGREILPTTEGMDTTEEAAVESPASSATPAGAATRTPTATPPAAQTPTPGG